MYATGKQSCFVSLKVADSSSIPIVFISSLSLLFLPFDFVHVSWTTFCKVILGLDKYTWPAYIYQHVLLVYVLCFFINPQRACAARITVLGLCVCLSVTTFSATMCNKAAKKRYKGLQCYTSTILCKYSVQKLWCVNRSKKANIRMSTSLPRPVFATLHTVEVSEFKLWINCYVQKLPTNAAIQYEQESIDRECMVVDCMPVFTWQSLAYITTVHVLHILLQNSTRRGLTLQRFSCCSSLKNTWIDILSIWSINGVSFSPICLILH